MNTPRQHRKPSIPHWRANESGLAAMEFALVFPFLMMLLMGVYDFGNAFVVNQKVITSSQMMADLVSRAVVIGQEDFDDIVDAGRMAIAPYSTDSFSYDVVSIEYGADDETNICWRNTAGMAADDAPLDAAAPLYLEGEGVIVVTVRYNYEPLFASRFLDTLILEERAFTRGRRVPVISWREDDENIGCPGV